MRNENFIVAFSKESGGIKSIVNPNDTEKMNWCADDGVWGMPHSVNRISEFCSVEMKMIAFTESDNKSSSIYSNEAIEVAVDRFFSENGCLTERFTVRNLREGDIFLEHGDLRLEIPFNDRYTYADECITNRCHTHLWCAGNIVYVNALKMGESDINLGLVLTKGAAASYSVFDCTSNNRGIFVLDSEHIELKKGEEYVIEWQLFWHKGNKDFYKIASQYSGFITVEAENYTVFDDERIEFTLKFGCDLPGLTIYCDGEKCSFEKRELCCNVSYKPKRLGQHRFEVCADNFHTYTEFFVSEIPEKVIEKRIDFIIDRQQYHRNGSQLDGAFLIYDNKEKYPIYDSIIRDHNACRERVGMALLIIKYLQLRRNEKYLVAIKKYIDYLFREFFDPYTGEVFDGVGHNEKFIRLYNAPWIVTLFTEMYFLTEDKIYLAYIIKILNVYYSGGGSKFYPNGLSVYKTVSAFKKAGMAKEKKKILEWFTAHIENMISNGLSYPKHEVNFEQTIVTPAATFISEMALITGEDKYVREAERHIKLLERFNGHQPSFHLNEIPIRYWDDFWFGKSKMFGDTFPHYWSCLTARAYSAYFKASGDKKYHKAAEMCIRNCLCLFNENGEGSCAYVYPFRLNSKNGKFYDDWANDQDFALYFLLVLQE